MATDWAVQSVEHSRLVARVRRGEEEAESELYLKVVDFARAPLVRLLRGGAEDVLHDVFLEVLTAIRDTELREGSRLKPFVLTIARRLAWAQIYRNKRLTAISRAVLEEEILGDDRTLDQMLHRERVRLCGDALRSLKPPEREVLARFYVEAERPDAICSAMGLSETQYRLLKSRAKKKCATWIADRGHSCVA